jgi:hypothetical protein
MFSIPRAFSGSNPQRSSKRAPFGVSEIAAPASFLKEDRSKTWNDVRSAFELVAVIQSSYRKCGGSICTATRESLTSTSWPALLRAIAALSPASPAPTMPICKPPLSDLDSMSICRLNWNQENSLIEFGRPSTRSQLKTHWASLKTS